MTKHPLEKTTPNSISPASGWTRAKAFITPEIALLIAILFGALIVRLAFSVYEPPTLAGDSAYYHSIAENLLRGQGYSRNGVEPTRFRTPTYPVFLATVYLLFGHSLKAVVYVQAFLGALTCLLTYFLANYVFGRRSGLIAALIVASYPALVYYDNRILRESITTLLLIGSVLMVVDRPQLQRSTSRLLVTGALLALLTLCRPEMLFVSCVIIYLVARPFRHPRFLRQILLILLPISMVWIPWTVRNYVTFGTLSPVRTSLGGALWFGSRWADIGGDDHTPEARQALQKETREIADVPEASIERRFQEEAFLDMRERPAWYLHMIWRKLTFFWKDANGVNRTLPAIHPLLARTVNAYYYSLILLALVGAIAGRRRSDWVMPLVGVIFTFMMTYVLLHVRNRYRVPVLPFLFVFSAGGFWILYDNLKAFYRKTFNAVGCSERSTRESRATHAHT